MRNIRLRYLIEYLEAVHPYVKYRRGRKFGNTLIDITCVPIIGDLISPIGLIGRAFNQPLSRYDVVTESQYVKLSAIQELPGFLGLSELEWKTLLKQKTMPEFILKLKEYQRG